MTPLEKIAKMDKISKLSATLLIVSFICGMMNPSNALWVIPIAAAYLSTSMINSDIRRMKTTINNNYGSGEEEHF